MFALRFFVHRIQVLNPLTFVLNFIFIHHCMIAIISALIRVSTNEILRMQREKFEEKQRLEEEKNRVLKGSGRLPPPQVDVFMDES